MHERLPVLAVLFMAFLTGVPAKQGVIADSRAADGLDERAAPIGHVHPKADLQAGTNQKKRSRQLSMRAYWNVVVAVVDYSVDSPCKLCIMAAKPCQQRIATYCRQANVTGKDRHYG